MEGRSLAILAVVLFVVGVVLIFFVDVRPVSTVRGVVFDVSGSRAVIVQGDKLNVSLGNRSVHVGQNVILNGWYDGNMFVVGGRDGK